MKSIDLAFISKYRSAFMGLAIFWIFFYHTGVDIPVFREIFALGWMGVDIFFFVSGFGLCASLERNKSTKKFFIRRFSRIIPTWWIVLALMAIFGMIAGLKGFPTSGKDYFYWFTGCGWWTGNCNFEWYIPTLIVFYFLAPAFSRLTIKALVILTVSFALAAILLGYLSIFKHIYMSYSRLPIYIYGFICYKYWKQGNVLRLDIWLPLALIGSLLFCVGMYVKSTDVILGLTIARIFIPLFIVPMLYIMSKIIGALRPLESAFSFLGLISLEIYLIHINHESSHFIMTTALRGVHDWLVNMVWFAIVVIAAWILHESIQFLRTNKWTKPHDHFKA